MERKRTEKADSGRKVETRILLHVEKRNGNSAEKAEHCGGKLKWNDRYNGIIKKKARSEQRKDVWHGCCVGSCIAVKSGRAGAWTCGTNSYG